MSRNITFFTRVFGQRSRPYFPPRDKDRLNSLAYSQTLPLAAAFSHLLFHSIHPHLLKKISNNFLRILAIMTVYVLLTCFEFNSKHDWGSIINACATCKQQFFCDTSPSANGNNFLCKESCHTVEHSPKGDITFISTVSPTKTSLEFFNRAEDKKIIILS